MSRFVTTRRTLPPHSARVRCVRSTLMLTLVLFAGPSTAWAQVSAECATIDCRAPATSNFPNAPTLPNAPNGSNALNGSNDSNESNESNGLRVHRLRFVEALQRFTRAQAGTFTDEGAALLESLGAMHDVLTQWDVAIRQFRSSAGRLAATPDRHVMVATVLLERGHHEEALGELRAAERMENRRGDVQILLAFAYAALGRAEPAARAFRLASEADPSNPTLLYRLAEQLTALGRREDATAALRDFERAVARHGRQHDERTRRQPFDRIDLLRQAPGVAPVFPLAQYSAGYQALHKGDLEGALASFDRAVAADPLVAGNPDEQPLIDEAAALVRRGHLKAASLVLAQARANGSTGPAVHRLSALISWIDGQSGDAIDHLRAALRIGPRDERSLLLLADVLTADGRLSEAERELQTMIEAGLASGQVHYQLAQIYGRRSLLAEAVAELEAAERFGAIVGRDRFYQLLGSMRVDRADFDGAVSAYRHRIAANPNHGEAHRQLGEILVLQGRHDEALAEFSAATWLSPEDARAHAAAGQVYLRIAKYRDAAAALERALALDATLREARYGLATALLRLGDQQRAGRELALFEQQQSEAEARGREEFRLDVLRREGSRAIATGDPLRAVMVFEQVLAADPSAPRSHLDLGIALLRAGRPKEAVIHLSQTSRKEETREGLRHLVDAFTAMGDRASAAQHLTRYQALLAREILDRIRELAGER